MLNGTRSLPAAARHRRDPLVDFVGSRGGCVGAPWSRATTVATSTGIRLQAVVRLDRFELGPIGQLRACCLRSSGRPGDRPDRDDPGRRRPGHPGGPSLHHRLRRRGGSSGVGRSLTASTVLLRVRAGVRPRPLHHRTAAAVTRPCGWCPTPAPVVWCCSCAPTAPALAMTRRKASSELATLTGRIARAAGQGPRAPHRGDHVAERPGRPGREARGPAGRKPTGCCRSIVSAASPSTDLVA